jgi:Ca2+-binding RTX toxin-like protein
MLRTTDSTVLSTSLQPTALDAPELEFTFEAPAYNRSAIYGTANSDTIYVPAPPAGAASLIYAGGGNDKVYGSSGEDKIHGDGGNDTLFGYGDDDALFGGSGDDHLYGGPGMDMLQGGTGNDYLSGGSGIDHLKGGDGHDTLLGGIGTNYMWDGEGNDALVAGAQAGDWDWMFGDAGNDIFYLNSKGAGDDWVDMAVGGTGWDVAVFNQADATADVWIIDEGSGLYHIHWTDTAGFAQEDTVAEIEQFNVGGTFSTLEQLLI